MSRFFQQFINFFRPLNGAQRALFILFAAGLILVVSLLFYWALKPSHTLLFGSLAPDSAREIVEELQSMGVPYQLSDNGRTINVPRDKVYELRIRFAADGLAGSETRGYELFDQNALGMTDFMQRLNRKRALEGELSRTINNLAQVESSRIHIVLPERSPFQESTVSPSASVILNLRRGRNLERNQIEGIGSLIAGSVEGLSVEDVVILDQLGNRISENVLVSSESSAGSSQMRIRKDVEAYLTDKAQSMLDRVLGPGNSIIRVSTEHNFDRIVRKSDLIDPESRTIISEERRTTRNTGQSQEAVQAENEIEPFVSNLREDESTVQVRNYEVNKILEQYENVVGEVTRISASLLLNHRSGEEGGEGPVPYTDEEIGEIRTIISSALGIVEERGDRVTVTQTRFRDPFAVDGGPEGNWLQTLPPSEVIRYLFVTLMLIIVAWMVYRMSGRFGSEVESLLPEGEKRTGADDAESRYLASGGPEEEGEDFYGGKLSSEARRKLSGSTRRNEEISRFIDEHSSEAAALVRALMNQNPATDEGRNG